MEKTPILISPYIFELISNYIPFILFYDTGQLLEGNEVPEYKHEHALGKGILEGFWDEDAGNYCLRETNVYELSVYFEFLTERSFEDLRQYLNGMDMIVFDNYSEFKLYREFASKFSGWIKNGE